jgi:uncharacterized protein YdaU (DUF1376 family)
MSTDSLAMLPWFHSSFLAATQGWTLEERGAYFMLLGAQWETGPLPNEMNRLAGIVGVPPAAMKLLWKKVGDKFKVTESGLINERLEEHRRRSVSLRDAKRRGAEITNATLGRGSRKVVPIRSGGGPQ